MSLTEAVHCPAAAAAAARLCVIGLPPQRLREPGTGQPLALRREGGQDEEEAPVVGTTTMAMRRLC